jgi:ribose transport system substrate-binding protein
MVASFTLFGCKGEESMVQTAEETENVDDEAEEEAGEETVVADAGKTGSYGSLESQGPVEGDWEPVPEGEGKGLIALISNTADIPIVNAQRANNERVAALSGYETITFIADWDMSTQADQIETAIELGVDGMVISVIDEKAIIPSLIACKEAGIPIVTQDGGALDSPDTDGLAVCHVAADNFRAGEMAGEYIAWRLQGEGKVLLSGFESIEPGRLRTNGVMNVLKLYPNIEIVDYAEGGSVPAGLEAMENWLQAHPDADAVYAVNDPFGEGCYQAIIAAGKEDQMFIAGNDGDPQALEYMVESEGNTYAYTSAQWPQIMGVVSMENLIAYIEGREGDILANVEEQGVHHSWPIFLVPPYPISIETINSWPGWDVVIDWTDISPKPAWWE